MADLGNFASQLKDNTDSLKNTISNAIGGKLNSSIKNASAVPWKDVKSRFFHSIEIDPKRWDQLYPYRLLVIDAKKGNKVVNGTPTTKVTIKGDSANAIINFEPMGKQWIFTLPISPQQLAITDQFAINTTATQRGILEEHGGLKFKLINISGTMGTWAYRQSVTTPPSSPNRLQSVFGGTIEAATNLVDQAKRVINSATSKHPAEKPAPKRPETSDQGYTSTGYYQALALQQFLEQYAEAKLDPANSGWRLVFDIPKQNQSFVVTPMPFTWMQNVNSPMDISYTLQFKAWRRIDLKKKVSTATVNLYTISPGILQRILNTISEARRVTASAVDLIGAVRSDVLRPLDILRQTSLFVKDLSGIAVTVADLPFQIQKEYASSIKQSMLNLKDAISFGSSNSAVRGAITAIAASAIVAEGLSLAAVSTGQLGLGAAAAQSVDPSNNVFNQPERNFTLMDQVPAHSLSLTNSQSNTIQQAVDDARDTTVDDLKTFRGVILELALQLSNNFGAGDSYYNQVYGKPAPSVRIQPMTLDEYDILKTLYDVVQSYDILTATSEIDDLNKKTSMEYVAGLADQSDIPFDVPNSKIMVPVVFGLTVEGLAQRYLGDAQRWLEIVTLNNLRDPYIDENGFQLPLLSNATGRQITIASIENLFINQRVVLHSATQSPTARRIIGIDRLSDTSFLLTLDGKADLDPFTTSDGAYLKAYLPGTVNSQQKIFIPSDLPVPTDPNITVPSSTASDPLVGLSKVDWLLTSTGDVAANNYGDFRFSAGITNLIQALKIKLATIKGTVLLHPDFGLGLRAGVMNSEVDAQDIYNNINSLVEEDPRFEGLDSLQITINGPVLSINMGVIIAGVQGVFPLTFELPVS